MKRLDEAPGFFRGSDVRIRVEDGPLAPGCLARLDEIAVMFELRIVEVAAAEAHGAHGSARCRRGPRSEPRAPARRHRPRSRTQEPHEDDEADRLAGCHRGRRPELACRRPLVD